MGRWAERQGRSWRRLAGLGVGLAMIISMVGATGAQAQTSSGLASATQTVEPGVSDSIVRLYYAVFDRLPDESGREYWVGEYVDGVKLPSIAAAFMASPEWLNTYGVVNDARFVELLYNNVLDRSPDDGGDAYWQSLLASGTTRVSILLGFSESQEFVNVTGTAAPKAPPPPPFPAVPAHSNAGRRVVYSNSMQRVWWIDESNTVVQSYLVSGRRGVPASGTYSVYSKSPVAWAGHDGITMTHMVRFARSSSSGISIGFHGIPTFRDGTPMQTTAQLGTFRSAGCVRQRNDLAADLYAWASIGTTVVVLP